MNMNQYLTEHADVIRISIFFGILLVLSIWEVLAPRRKLTQSKIKRWFSNLSLIVLNTTIIRIAFTISAVGIALLAKEHQWGIFNYFEIPPLLSIIISVILLDLTIYLQHVMFHHVPVFWRIHKMHHLDLDIDVTTGIRFHPFEMILSMLIKFAVIILIGAPVIAVILFEIILNATSLFNHSNIRLHVVIDKIIRFFVVTPDMHRVHHSTIPDETNSNFGFNLSLWDRIFRTYCAQPRQGHDKMTIGLSNNREPKICSNVLGMLMVPFIKK